MTGREQVDWLVFSRVWDRTREHVTAEFGETEGYLSRTVETAMREAIGEHRYEPVERKVRDLVTSVGAQKTRRDDVPTFVPAEYTGKTRIGVYVDEALLEKWRNHVDKDSQYNYGVALSQHLAYYLQGGRPDSLVTQLDRVLTEIEGDESRSTAEEIIDQLDDQFSLEDFRTAAANAGVHTTNYALEQHLPRVIDEMNVAPLPTNTDVFVPRSSELIPAVPNPALLPYHAMSDDDKRLAVKIAAIEAAFDADSRRTTFTVSDGVAALDGRPQQSTVRSLLRDLDHERVSNGISYDGDLPGLKLKEQQIKETREDHGVALQIIRRSRNSDAGENEEDHTVSSWVERAAKLLSDLPSDVGDPVITNKIVRAKYPEEVDDIEGPTTELQNRVTETERMRVKEHLDWIYISTTVCNTTESTEWQALKTVLEQTPDYAISAS